MLSSTIDFTPSLPTLWEDISATFHSTSTSEEKSFRSDVASGTVASPMNKIRLFGSDTESDIRVIFYRDHASWCPYCHKVWAMLELKQISYRVEKVNMRCYGQKTPKFLRLQPNGNIPVAEIYGTVIRQSNDIIYALESMFPSSITLMYAESEQERGNELLKLERELFTAWMYYLTGSRDPDRYKNNFAVVLGKVESALSSSSGGYFMGDRVTVVDVMYLPFLERMVSSMLYFKGFHVRDLSAFPSVCRWFDVMETLPAVRLTKSDHYTHCWDLPPQLGGCGMEPEGEPYALAIDGERDLSNPTLPSSWTLPPTPDLSCAETDWSWITPSSARRQGSESADEIVKGAKEKAEEAGMTEELKGSLAYLRDRIGVPRDMSAPAARWARGGLNNIIGEL